MQVGDSLILSVAPRSRKSRAPEGQFRKLEDTADCNGLSLHGTVRPMGNPKFKVGDVVLLKSGGPEMTIEGIGDEGWADCVWFSGLEAKRESFPLDALEAVPSQGSK